MSAKSQRLDKWLWYSRLVKTRSQAGRLIEAGKVRINKTRTTKPSSQLKPNDVVTAVINHHARVVKVLDPGKRRGPATEAQTLYEDLTPKSAETQTDKKSLPTPYVPKRKQGTGRPTKRDRRKMDRFLKRAERRLTSQNQAD